MVVANMFAPKMTSNWSKTWYGNGHCLHIEIILNKTPMHSSRMHTAYLLTISQPPPPGGRPPDADSPGHVTCDVCWEANHPHPHPSWTEEMTHACENITLPQTSLQAVINYISWCITLNCLVLNLQTFGKTMMTLNPWALGKYGVLSHDLVVETNCASNVSNDRCTLKSSTTAN